MHKQGVIKREISRQFSFSVLSHPVYHIATTQYSPELNNLDWGGYIITR